MAISVSTWDGNNINDTTNYTTKIISGLFDLPPVNLPSIPRSGRAPLLGPTEQQGRVILLRTFVVGGTAARRKQLRQWFDATDNTVKRLVIVGDEGETQYIEGKCESHVPEGMPGKFFLTAIRVHDDVAFRKTTATTPSNWSITATGQTNAYTNAGEMDAYPVISITPTSAKTGTNPFKRFIGVHWRTDAATSYPVDIVSDSLDTRVSPTTNFASATGDDIRVYVNGVLADFWLDGINTTTTKIWVNLNFSKGQQATLKTALGTGTIETIDVNEDISSWGDSGIIRIESEFFIYSSKNNSLKRFFIESRGAKGSTAAAHSASVVVRWIQHDITITYGSSALAAYVPDDDYKPIFTLATSTNTSWVYAEFGEDDGLRTGAWRKGIEYSTLVANYTTDAGTASAVPGANGKIVEANADPWTEIGIWRQFVSQAINPYFYAYNPCGITNANFTNGEKYAGFGEAQWNGFIRSGINGPNEFTEATIADPTLAATWQSWSQNEALRTGSKYVGIQLLDTQGGGGTEMYMEAADVTLTLNSSNTPNTTIGAEQGNYNLDATLTNNTTGDAIQITFQMELDETLTIDTWEGTVTYEADGSSQYDAVTRLGGPRLAWLTFQAGSNTWQFDDTGTNAVTVAISYEERRLA